MDDLQAAAVTLAREVKGAIGIAEPKLREALGDTNVAVLLHWADVVLERSRALDATAMERAR